MPTGFEPYVRCFRCGTSRPKLKLLANICSDGFCVRVLEVHPHAPVTAPSSCSVNAPESPRPSGEPDQSLVGGDATPATPIEPEPTASAPIRPQLV